MSPVVVWNIAMEEKEGASKYGSKSAFEYPETVLINTRYLSPVVVWNIAMEEKEGASKYGADIFFKYPETTIINMFSIL